MKRISSTLGVAALVLCAGYMQAATSTPQARITIVEHNAAGSQSASDPSVAKHALPGHPVQEAHVFTGQTHIGTPRSESIELAFHATTSVKTITATNDFHVVDGGTCRENQTYSEGDSCTLVVEFKGMGPGHRAGQLKVGTAESLQPEVIGLQGDTLGAAIAFTPAVITTVPQTYVNSTPLLYAPGDVAVDEGDNLYFSDEFFGNSSQSGLVYFLDSSQVLTTIAGGGTTKLTSSYYPFNNMSNPLAGPSAFLQTPVGISVDPFLNVYVAEFVGNSLDLVSTEYIEPYAGLGTVNPTTCTASATCEPSVLEFSSPIFVKTDAEGNVFFNDVNYFYNIPYATSIQQNLGTPALQTLLPAAGNLGLTPASPFGLDSTDDIYADRYGENQTCQVEGWSPSNNYQWAAVGSGVCGRTGNGVRAQNAELSSYQSGYAFDAAGDLYIADTKNGMIRRVDSYNGLIHTVGGSPNLSNSYSGDSGPATVAGIYNPIGIAVDSNGVIYTTTFATGATLPYGAVDKAGHPSRDAADSVTTHECISNCGPKPVAVIRQIGPAGRLNLPVTLVGKTSASQTVLLTNVGNDALTVTSELMGGANPGDFVSDPTVTSCSWNSPLASGRSCQLGFACAPKAGGERTASVLLLDNTATFQNTINLSCFAQAAPVTPTVVVNPPNGTTAYPYLSNVPITVTVTNNVPGPTWATGTVTLTIKNVTTNTVYKTVGPLTLAGIGGNNSAVYYNLAGASNFTAGSYTITAAYSGDTFDNAASSTADPFTVSQLVPAITWATPNAIFQGSALSATQLDATATYTGTVPGTFTYTLPPSTTAICTVAVTTAAKACTPSTTVDMNTTGAIPIKVVFTPTDTTDYSTVNATVDVQVDGSAQKPKPTNTTLASKVNPTTNVAAIELTAAVKPLSGTTMPTGKITLFEGKTELATADLSSGTATIPLKGLSTGTHVLTAVYSGDTNHATSASNQLQQIVLTIGDFRRRILPENPEPLR